VSQVPDTIVLRRDRDLGPRRNGLTEGEVAEEMRAQQIASVEDVQWGILESNGTMSFIPK